MLYKGCLLTPFSKGKGKPCLKYLASTGVHCTLRVAGWKPTNNHIEITVGFFNLHKGWLSLHRGHSVNILIWRTMHLSSVVPANDTEETCSDSKFSSPRAGIEPGTSSTRGKCANHWATMLLFCQGFAMWLITHECEAIQWGHTPYFSPFNYFAFII